jgi:hippurate hydrolase
MNRSVVFAGLVTAVLVSGALGASAEEEIRAELAPTHAPLVDSWLDAHLEELLRDYRHLHAHPELSNEESETAAAVAEQLESAGYEVARAVGGHGVVGVLRNGDGPTLMIRGDMDALPILEETGLPYASEVRVAGPSDGRARGVMHACGHDIHTTGLVGTARLLASAGARALWSGTLVVVAQPAEEVGEGARRMMADGLFERFPRPDYALALHVDALVPAGQIQTVPGWARANVDSVDITIHGRSGHGARPHQAVDPIVAASQLVVALQTLVSRRVDPLEAAVVTVGSIHGGTKHNQIPDRVDLQLTVRSYTDSTRELLLDGIRQLAVDVCRSFGCPRPPDVRRKQHYTPALYNDPALDVVVRDVLRLALGPENVSRGRRAMGGEDFGRYSRELGIPAALIFLGSVDPAAFAASQQPGADPLPSLHSSRYAPEPRATLVTGVRALSHLALALLPLPAPIAPDAPREP